MGIDLNIYMFIKKYAPQTCDDITFHKKELNILKKMCDDNSVPHIVFYGPEGSGKKTLIKLFLELLYGKGVNNVNDAVYKVPGSNNVIEVTVKQSLYHIVIEPNNNNFDRYLIQEVIKKYAQKVPINIFTSKKTFRTVLINNVDNLSYYAQTSLRRTMEKYSKTCRFIMWCKSLSKVIDPIRSRCYGFRIRAPKNSAIFEFLLTVAYKESIEMTRDKYIQILQIANGNVKNALWLLQYTKLNIEFDRSYEELIVEIAKWIIANDTNAILVIRAMVYSSIISNVDESKLIVDITKYLCKSDMINERCKMNIAEVAAEFEHRLVIGRRKIDHIEAFVCGVIYIVGKYRNEVEPSAIESA